MYKIVQFLNAFSETAGAIFTRFHMGSSVERVLTICLNGSASLNEMPCQYMVKALKNLQTKKALRLNPDTEHQGLKVYQVYSNDVCRLTFDLFTARSNLPSHTFVCGKSWKIIFSVCFKD